MIPETIVRFLDRANAAHLGTRDRQLVPHGHRVSGWTVGPGARTLTVLLPEIARPGLFEALDDNGQLAVTIEEYPSHEVYQFKGVCVGHRPAQPDETAVVDRVRERLLKGVRPLFGDGSAHVVRAITQPAVLAVELTVTEIFVQTPGPGAGRRLVPAEP